MKAVGTGEEKGGGRGGGGGGEAHLSAHNASLGTVHGHAQGTIAEAHAGALNRWAG